MNLQEFHELLDIELSQSDMHNAVFMFHFAHDGVLTYKATHPEGFALFRVATREVMLDIIDPADVFDIQKPYALGYEIFDEEGIFLRELQFNK